MSSSLTEVERRLVTLRIAHANDLDIRRVPYVVHGLRSNKDKLSSNRTTRSLDNHLHAALAVDTIHEYITAMISPGLDNDR
jgi:hypothetical protein